MTDPLASVGWAIEARWTHYHYFIHGTSLCEKFRHAGPVDAKTASTPIDCRDCQRKHPYLRGFTP